MDITFAYTRQGQWQMRHYIRQQMRMYIRCIAAFAMLLTMMTDVIAKSTEVEWELVGRYRLIKDSESEARLFDLATLAPDLQCAVDSRDKCTKDKYLSVIEAYSKKAPKGNIGFKKMPDTFYNSISGKYDEEYVKDPKHWKINFGINVDKPNTKKCNWYLDGIPVLGSGDCNKFQFNIPISAGQTVRVETNDGLTGTVTVIPKDILVVGMGDSFGSGEGTPDVPAETATRTAQWLDEKCHRSLLSAQSLAAARLAAENKHQSVTFISRACSGAIVADLIDLPAYLLPEPKYQRTGSIAALCYGGIHNTDCPKSNSNILPAQLDAVKSDLKTTDNQTRKPDLVLLSIGGNDFGFVEAIKDITFKDIDEESKPSENTNKTGPSLKKSFTLEAETKRKIFWESYPLLVSKLTGKYTGFADATFVQTGYPNPLMRDGANSKFCFEDGSAKDDPSFQITEQQGILGNTIDFFFNRFQKKGTQLEYIALHEDFLIPMTGSVKCLAKFTDEEAVKKGCINDEPHNYGLRPAMIAASCALKHGVRASLESAVGLQAMYQDERCKDLKKGDSGFESFDFFKESKWRFSLARNEAQDHSQLRGFIFNGFCINDVKKGVQGRWFNVMGDALTSQSIAADFLFGYATGGIRGTAHPNIYGQLFLAQRAWLAIPDELKKPKQ